MRPFFLLASDSKLPHSDTCIFNSLHVQTMGPTDANSVGLAKPRETMKRKPKPLSTSSRYRSFVGQRDKALEVILNRYLGSTSAIVSALKSQCFDLVDGLAASHKLTPLSIHVEMPRIKKRIEWLCYMSAQATCHQALGLRSSTYILAHVGEAEAIARALGKPQQVKATHRDLLTAKHRPSPTGGPLDARLTLYFSKLADEVSTALRYSMLLEESASDAKERVRLAFPKLKIIRKPKRELKPVPMREAVKSLVDTVAGDEISDEEGSGDLISGFVDNDSWDQMVADYKGDNLPGSRGPNDMIDVDGQERYEWEVEQELTQDFVEQVRLGQNEAANANGIEDFMWIAIVDDATDDCCLKRDGLTSTEIENKLSGEWKNDECKATVPPAHFKCRCVPAPVSTDLPDESPPDYGDIDQWLNER